MVSLSVSHLSVRDLGLQHAVCRVRTLDCRACLQDGLTCGVCRETSRPPSSSRTAGGSDRLHRQCFVAYSCSWCACACSGNRLPFDPGLPGNNRDVTYVSDGSRKFACEALVGRVQGCTRVSCIVAASVMSLPDASRMDERDSEIAISTPTAYCAHRPSDCSRSLDEYSLRLQSASTPRRLVT